MGLRIALQSNNFQILIKRGINPSLCLIKWAHVKKKQQNKFIKWQNLFKKVVLSFLILFGILSLLVGLEEINYYSHQNKAKKNPYSLYVQSSGEEGDNLIFLHGLAGSNRYWQKQINNLNVDFQVMAVDLLGFGKSSWPDIEYSIDEHVSAFSETISKALPTTPLKMDKINLVGHSLGALIALQYASENPTLVNKLILAAPPFFNSMNEVKNSLKEISEIQSVMSLNPVLAPVLCYFHGALGKFALPFFRPFLKEFPEVVKADSMLHTWASFHGSLENAIVGANIFDDLAKLRSDQILILLGDADKNNSQKDIKRLRALNINVVTIKGSHNFPLDQPLLTTRLIRDFIKK